ncbi:hypothetical protein B0H16DRAFT_1448522 [Mycena metata]|uniref:Uncharacterized protein n=1 Tax=Mycena metata TaxID=1033252 RepID=A0AAD7K8E3_9AGAR|nr:hypothetical protein B0H16DRAFT_1448522 [Mycena metata]
MSTPRLALHTPKYPPLSPSVYGFLQHVRALSGASSLPPHYITTIMRPNPRANGINLSQISLQAIGAPLLKQRELLEKHSILWSEISVPPGSESAAETVTSGCMKKGYIIVGKYLNDGVMDGKRFEVTYGGLSAFGKYFILIMANRGGSNPRRRHEALLAIKKNTNPSDLKNGNIDAQVEPWERLKRSAEDTSNDERSGRLGIPVVNATTTKNVSVVLISRAGFSAEPLLERRGPRSRHKRCHNSRRSDILKEHKVDVVTGGWGRVVHAQQIQDADRGPGGRLFENCRDSIPLNFCVFLEGDPNAELEPAFSSVFGRVRVWVKFGLLGVVKRWPRGYVCVLTW